MEELVTCFRSFVGKLTVELTAELLLEERCTVSIGTVSAGGISPQGPFCYRGSARKNKLGFAIARVGQPSLLRSSRRSPAELAVLSELLLWGSSWFVSADP